MSSGRPPALHVVACLGTRPEAIKLAPVVMAARRAPGLAVSLVTTGQHAAACDEVLDLFELIPDARLNVLRRRQSLPSLAARCLDGLGPVLEERRPAIVLVQGDTTSAAMAALAGFYLRVPVWHVEAGLRTDDMYSPFPEEMNRRLISRLASVHLAPTESARANLLREGIPGAAIAVTGNTGIDALLLACTRRSAMSAVAVDEFTRRRGPLLVVTMHRRENWGDPIRSVASAVRSLVDEHPDLQVVWAAHPNPDVRRAVDAVVKGCDRILVTDPAGYGDFVLLLRRASVILTDSGGIQEEAPSLGVPVVVAREQTERREGIAAGVAVLAGTSEASVRREVARALFDREARRRIRGRQNPYGDGRAARRVVALLVARGRADGRPPGVVDGRARRPPPASLSGRERRST